MSFYEKSAWIVFASVAVVYGWYFLSLADAFPASESVRDISYRGAMFGTVITLVVMLVLFHVTAAIIAPRDVETFDERDREIERFGQYVGGHVAGGTAIFGLGLAMFEQPHFWIANALLGGIVLAQLIACGTKVVLYRRGF